MKIRRATQAVGLTVLLLVAAPRWVRADGSWLDGPLQQWNSAGMAVPAAPSDGDMATADPRCAATARPIETAEDRAVSDAGWTLFGEYSGGWGVTVIAGLTGYDGMCRPGGYQDFVFVDGVFAGTISPVPMNSREDGAASSIFIQAAGSGLTSSFSRYADTDPRCCPHAVSYVSYRIDRSGGGPVLMATSVSTSSAGQ